MNMFVLLIEPAKDGFSARDFVEVGPYAPNITLVHYLSYHTVDVQSGREQVVQLG